VAKQGTQSARIFLRQGSSGWDAEMPEAEEFAEPGGAVEKFGKIAEAVPDGAVDEIEPGSGGAEAAIAKRVGRVGHCNELKQLDTLHSRAYCKKRA